MLIRVLILITTNIPFIITKTIVFILIKTETLIKTNKEKKNLIKYVVLQIILTINTEINMVIKNLKIKFLKNKIKFNFDTWKHYASLKKTEFLHKSIFFLKKNIEFNFIKHIKENKIKTEVFEKHFNKKQNFLKQIKDKKILLNKEDLNYDQIKNIIKENPEFENDINNFLEKHLKTTKPHFSILFKDLNGKIVYKNETTKDELWVFDTKTQKFTNIKLGFLHDGLLIKSKKSFYTPNIITEQNNIIEENVENTFKNIQNIKSSQHNLIIAFLLDLNENMLNTLYIETENKYILTKYYKDYQEPDQISIDKTITLKECKELFSYFVEQNPQVFLNMDEKDKENFIKNIFKTYYKSEFLGDKELTFYILKKT